MQKKPPARVHLTAAEFGLPESVACPFCEGADTELHSAFGGQLSVSTYWCRGCRTAFEWFNRSAPQAADAGTRRPGDAAAGDDAGP